MYVRSKYETKSSVSSGSANLISQNVLITGWMRQKEDNYLSFVVLLIVLLSMVASAYRRVYVMSVLPLSMFCRIPWQILPCIGILTLKLPITTSRLLVILKVIFANSVDPDQAAPLGAV